DAVEVELVPVSLLAQELPLAVDRGLRAGALALSHRVDEPFHLLGMHLLGPDLPGDRIHAGVEPRLLLVDRHRRLRVGCPRQPSSGAPRYQQAPSYPPPPGRIAHRVPPFHRHGGPDPAVGRERYPSGDEESIEPVAEVLRYIPFPGACQALADLLK